MGLGTRPGGGGGGGGGGTNCVGGLDPRYDKRIGGAVRFRPDPKGGGGGGGGGGCLAEEREAPYMKGQLYDLLNSAHFTIDY